MRVHSMAVMAGLVLGTFPGASRAAYIVNVAEVGTSVVFTGSGTLDTSSLKAIDIEDELTAYVNGGDDILGIGIGPSVSYGYISGPSFGADVDFFTKIATGPRVGLFGGFGHDFIELTVPKDYVPNTVLGTSTATFENASLKSLDLTTGSYVFTFGGRAAFDTFTVNISPVPLPDSVSMFGAALLGLSGLGYAAKRKKAATAA